MAYQSVPAFLTECGVLYHSERDAINHELREHIFFQLAGDERFKAAELAMENASVIIPLLKRHMELQSHDVAALKRSAPAQKEGDPPFKPSLLSEGDTQLMSSKEIERYEDGLRAIGDDLL